MNRTGLFALVTLLGSLHVPIYAATFDVSMPSGDNYDKAMFRLWIPDNLETARALMVLVPGSNGDGRGQVDDPFWRELATKHGLALVGVYLTDHHHEHMFIEHYIDVRRGTGRAFLDGLEELASSSGHAEIATAPFLLWGMSAGGEFNYEMALWKPERVLGFIVNKGNIYYSAMAPPEAWAVPGLFFIGEIDLEFRNDIIRGIYSANRRAHALWALVEEPGVGHEIARSKDMAAMFFEDLLELRLTKDGLRALEHADGYLCDPKTNTCASAAGAEQKRYPTAWLPTKELADAWLAVTTGAPF